VRPGHLEDRPAIERILRATSAFTDEEVVCALDLVTSGCEHPGRDYFIRVFETGAGPPARVLGYTCHGRSPFTEGTYDLYWIAVDPAHHGSGAARALMSAVESEVAADGGRLILVDTASKPSYARTRAFYEKIGYREVSRIRDYYRPGDDRITYEKRFSPHGTP
jgi:ribosomal protein S18 acetylase RimI-like enzyme